MGARSSWSSYIWFTFWWELSSWFAVISLSSHVLSWYTDKGRKRERGREREREKERDRERDEEGEGVGGRRREMRERIFSDVSSYKGTNSMDQGPTLMTSFNLSYFLRGPISKYSYTGVRASNYGFWQGHIHSVHNTSKHTIPNWKLWYMPRKKKIEALFRAVFRWIILWGLLPLSAKKVDQ